ncbi:hypothetical protein G7046_g4499 [Stylonectria norvegica]|nr:hypothetical protein G7046_g4499 [Stylonectria norvegica]
MPVGDSGGGSHLGSRNLARPRTAGEGPITGATINLQYSAEVEHAVEAAGYRAVGAAQDLTALQSRRGILRCLWEYLLSLMPQLRELRLHALPSGCMMRTDFDYLTKTRLRYLESLDLMWPRVRIESFAEFMSQHASTIKTLKMKNIEAMNPMRNEFLEPPPLPPPPPTMDWDQVFRQMQRECNKLEAVSIEGTIGVEDDNIKSSESERMERFILEGGEYPQPDWMDPTLE